MKHFNQSFTKDSYSGGEQLKSGHGEGCLRCMICTKQIADASGRVWKTDIESNG